MINELSQEELKDRDEELKKLMVNKHDFVSQYGKDAEKVMVGKATNMAKNKVKMNKTKIKEIVKKYLAKPPVIKEEEAIGLKDRVKNIVKKVYVPKTIDLNAPEEIIIDNERFPVLGKFPELKKVLINLLTHQFEIFLDDIQWVAPRPTTFRIVLANKYYFYLIYGEEDSWVAQIEGKKYYILDLPEEERASEAIARILTYGNPNSPTETPAEDEDTKEEVPAKKEPEPKIPENPTELPAEKEA